MTVKQTSNTPVSLLTFISVITPFVIIIIGWGINVNIRLSAIEIEIENQKQKGVKMEQTLDAIACNLSSIAISINTLTVKWDENEKQDNRKLENVTSRN